MAVIYAGTSSAFSTATYTKVVASALTINTASSSGYTTTSTERYIAFTPSENATMTGAFLFLRNATLSAAQSYTVHLETNSGGWADVAGATCTATYAAVGGNFATTFTSGALIGYYFEFTTPAAITNVADTWRISIKSTDGNGYLINDATSGYDYGIVTSTAASYSSGDSLIIKQNITMTVDQSMTFGVLAQGVDSIVQWQNPALASYTLTNTTWIMSMSVAFNYGTALNPIAAAVRGTLVPGTMKLGMQYTGTGNNKFTMYGAKPTNYYTTLAALGATGQKNITTTDNMSALWSNGDTLWIYGGIAPNGTNQIRSDTIASMSGTTITMTNNLPLNYISGYFVVNFTKAAAACGAVLGGSIAANTVQYGQNFTHFKMSGVNMGAYIVAWNGVYNMDAYTTQMSSFLLEDCITTGSGSNMGLSGNALTAAVTTALNGSTIQRFFVRQTTGRSLVFGNLSNTLAVTDCGFGSYAWNCDVTGTNITFTRLQVSGAYSESSSYDVSALLLTSCTLTNCKWVGANYGIKTNGASVTFTNCTFDNMTYGIVPTSNCIAYTFTNCQFGQSDANTNASILNTANYLLQFNMNNCKFDTVPVYQDTITSSVIGSYIKSDTHNQTTNNHLSWSQYGKIQSTSTGLTDTTEHTAGGLAMRFEPLSSTNNQTWAFDVPTGNIINKTMSLAVWCKINSATYYAGTNQMPRLTVNYDNGTIAYSQAAQNTGWQLLFLSFTPTTTYGQITVTLSARTDATTTNAYVYWDDFAVLYPNNVILDLGSFDNWANALPVTPPIATPISAYTIANAVFEELLSSHTTSGSFGEAFQSQFIRINSCQTGGTGTQVILDTGASSSDNFYNENYILIMTGLGAGQARRIVSYNGTSKVVTINRAWVTNPDSTSRYCIIPFFSVENAVWDSLTSSHTTTSTFGEKENNDLDVDTFLALK